MKGRSIGRPNEKSDGRQEGTGSGSAFGATSFLKNENTDKKRTIALVMVQHPSA